MYVLDDFRSKIPLCLRIENLPNADSHDNLFQMKLPPTDFPWTEQYSFQGTVRSSSLKWRVEFQNLGRFGSLYWNFKFLFCQRIPDFVTTPRNELVPQRTNGTGLPGLVTDSDSDSDSTRTRKGDRSAGRGPSRYATHKLLSPRRHGSAWPGGAAAQTDSGIMSDSETSSKKLQPHCGGLGPWPGPGP